MPLQWSASLGVSAAFSPSDLSSIWEWWEPSRNGFTPDQEVETMAGQVAPGAGHNFTATSPFGPTYNDAILNGLGVLRFNGISESLQNVNPSALTAAHLFLVIRVVAESTARGVWQFGTSGSSDHYAFTDGVIYDGACSTTRRTVGNPAPPLTDWNVVEVVSTSSEWTYKLNGVEMFTTATNTVALNSNCKIGTWDTLVKACDIAGNYLCSAKLNTTDRDSLVNYINERFDLAVV